MSTSSTQATCQQCGNPFSKHAMQGMCSKCIASAMRALAGIGGAQPKVGERIGEYMLLQRLDEGGFGVVFLAQREGKAVNQVALKLLKHRGKRGGVVPQLDKEARAMADLNHPQIAKVFDVDVTSEGDPYLVVELVRGGRPITQYCDEHQLGIRERLEIMVSVVRAVQYLHNKGIVHRDIKPSNILATEEGGVREVKLIDFGISVVLGEELTHRKLLAGTPGYMSPEQALLGSSKVDASSDIYSLGVVLDELLTGTLPFATETLCKTTLSERKETLAHTAPALPSERIAQLKPSELSANAKARNTRPEKLASRIRGDLDAIVMKCLQKDPEERYSSAGELAQDIVRHLEHEPITARSTNGFERLEKFVQRNKLLFSAAASMSIALVIGLAATTWLFFKERAARSLAEVSRKSAQTEAARSQQVAQFMKNILDGVGPSAALGRDTKMLQEILDKTVERIGQELKDQPDVEAELRRTIGNVYSDISAYDKGEEMLRKALNLRRSVYGDMDLRTADSLVDLGDLLRHRGKSQEAETQFRQAMEIRKVVAGENSEGVAAVLNNISVMLLGRGATAEAEEMLLRSLKIRRTLHLDETPGAAFALHSLGNVYLTQGKLSQAETNYLQAAAIRRRILGSPHPLLAMTLGNLGSAMWYQGKLPEAEKYYRETLAMQRLLLGTEHKDVATSTYNIACLLLSRGKYADSAVEFEESLRIRRKLLGEDHPDVASTLSGYASCLLSSSALPEAETNQRQALAIQKKVLGESHQDVAVSLNNLGDILRVRGKLEEAEGLERQAVEKLKSLLGNDHQLVATALGTLGNVLRDAGELTEAELVHREALSIRLKSVGKKHADTAQSYNDLGRILKELGKNPEALPLLTDALTLRRELLGNDHPDTLETMEHLAALQETLGNASEALYREVVNGYRNQLPEDYRYFRSLTTLGSFYLRTGQFEKAEPLLMEAHSGLQKNQVKFPYEGRNLLKTASGQIVKMFVASGQLRLAEEWLKKSGTSRSLGE